MLRRYTGHVCNWIPLVLIAVGCSAPRGVPLTPGSLRVSVESATEADAVLERWESAVELANEFLASSFNRSLPAGSRVSLDATGMRLTTPDRTMPIPVVLIDEYLKSACVCSNVDTHENVVYAFRPWRSDAALPIAASNTFFAGIVSVSANDEPTADLAQRLLRLATILYYEEAAHMSSWEVFKCQKLEWLLGSGHHRQSMQRPGAVFFEFFYFWNGVEPPTPTMLQVMKRHPDFERRSAERSREARGWREAFEERLANPDEQADHGPYDDEPRAGVDSTGTGSSRSRERRASDPGRRSPGRAPAAAHRRGTDTPACTAHRRAR